MRVTSETGPEARERDGIAFHVNMTVVMLGIVLTGLIAVAMTSNFFLPFLDAIGDALDFGGTNQTKAVNSAKGLALAVSCTSIMNSHPTESGNVNRYAEEWQKPLNQQGFGSSISFSCEDTVPAEGEKGDQRGAWFAPPEENGVNVVCEGYNQSGKGCKIYNFALPQDVPYTGPELENVVDFPGSSPEQIMKAWGGPEYVLYYQKVSDAAVGNWQKRGDGVSTRYIIGSLALEALGLPLGRLAGRAAAFGRTVSNRIGLARLYTGARTSTREMDARIRETLAASDRFGCSATERAYQLSKGFGKAAMKVAHKGPIGGTGWIGRRMGVHTLGFLARKTSDLPARILGRLSSSGVSDEFYSRVITQYRQEMAQRMTQQGMPQLRRTADGGVDFANGMDKETWVREYARMSEESLEQAVRDVGNSMARRNQLPVSGDSLWASMRAASEGSVSVSTFARRQADELHLNVEAASQITRGADDVGGKWGAVLNDAGPEAVAAHGRRIKMTSDELVNDLLPRADDIEESTQYTIGEALRTDEAITSLTDKVEDYASKLSPDSPNFISSQTGRMVGAGVQQGSRVARGGGAFLCASGTVQSYAIDHIAGMMDPNVDGDGDGVTPAGNEEEEEIEANRADMFKSLGRCGVLANVDAQTFGGLCRRMGVNVPSNAPGAGTSLRSSATYGCAAVSFMGYAANRLLAEKQYKTPREVNSLYLATVGGPPNRIPLHPIANWYFVGLDRSGNNPDDRFFLAAPMETRRIQDSNNPHISIMPGTMESTMSGKHLAQDHIGPNTSTEGVSDCSNIIGDVATGVQDTVGETVDESIDIIPGASLSCEADVDDDDSTEDLLEDERQAEFEEAIACGKAGTYLKTSNDCTDELVYTDTPQVRRTPGPTYALNPQAGVPSPPSLAGFLFDGTYDGSSEALEASDEEGTGQFVEGEFLELIGINHSQVPEEEYEDPRSSYTTESFVIPETGACDTVRVGICSERVSPWSGDDSCEVKTTNSDSLSGSWYEELDSETEASTVGISCTTESDGTSTVAAKNVQQMRYLSPGPDRGVGPNYFRQLWYWDDPINDSDCQGEDAADNGEGNCMFNWKDNRGLRPKSQEVVGDTDRAMKNMYPRVYPGDTGVTVYQDATTVNGLFSGFTDWLDAKKQSKTKEYRSVIISVEGVPDNNWQREDGKAVYGYNSDIESNAWASAILTTAALGAAVVVTVGSFGTGAAVAAAAFGAADVVGREYIGLQSSWPNH